MPKRKVVFSGLLAFGAGVAVGANWPRAGNFVGYLLQRLGFELTDLTLWMWDPEKSLAQTKAASPVVKPKSKKKALLPLAQTDHRPASAGKTKSKGALGRGIPSAAGTRARRKSSNDAGESWILNSHARQSAKNGTSYRGSKPAVTRLSLTKLEDSAIGTVRRKSKDAAGKRKNRQGSIVTKSSTFRRAATPANAALN